MIKYTLLFLVIYIGAHAFTGMQLVEQYRSTVLNHAHATLNH